MNNRREISREAVQDAFGRYRGSSSSVHFHGLPRVVVLGCVLFAVLAVMPTAFGINPSGYQLGQALPYDIISRVDFAWRDPGEEQRAIAEIEANYSNRYLQDPEWEWTPRVTSAVWQLIEKADAIDDPAALLEAAKASDLTLTPEQAEVFVRTLQGGGDRIETFPQIISPMQYVLREYVFPRGILESSRYKVELGKAIQIINQDGDVRVVRVSRNDPDSPLEMEQIAPVLDQGFSRMRVPLEFRIALRDVLLPRIVPNLQYDAEGSNRELEDRKNRVRIETQQVFAGRTVLVPRNTPLTATMLAKLRAEGEAFRQQRGWLYLLRKVGGKGVLFLLLAIAVAYAMLHWALDPRIASRNVFAVLGAVLVVMTLMHLCVAYALPVILLPLSALVGLTAFLIRTRAAVVLVASAGAFILILFEGQPDAALACWLGGTAMALLAPRSRRARDIGFAGIGSGALVMLITLAWGTIRQEPLGLLVMPETTVQALTGATLGQRALLAAVSWSLGGALLLAILPGLERTFNLTTRLRLHELQDLDQPILRKLALEAPGSYHHSLIVGTLAEAGAEAIGADALLAKVGSYYHDIGKLMKPEYFSENDKGLSRHDSLQPSMSALIIMAHVKDGAEMARELGLPAGVIALISEHHGTGLISYFHHRAKAQASNGETVNEHLYRYPGPVPQSPEAALIMFADSVEAATRSLDMPTPAHIRTLVHELVHKRLLDGQLEASGLTLSDLGRIEETFYRVLTSMFHSRIKYPGQEARGGRSKRR